MMILLLLLSEGIITITRMYERVNIYCAGLNSTDPWGKLEFKIYFRMLFLEEKIYFKKDTLCDKMIE